MFVSGQTASSDLFTEGYDINYGGRYDGFVAKFDNNLTCQAGSYLGGEGTDCASAVLIMSSEVYVAGSTGSTNFPPSGTHSGGGYDAFVVKMDSNLSDITYSPFVGGSGADDGLALALSTNNLILIGRTYSTDFPIPSGWDPTYNGGYFDAFLAKFGMDVVYIPNMTGGGIVEIPINVLATDIAGFSFEVTYNPDVLTAVGVEKGDLLDDNWVFGGNIEEEGRVVVSATSSEKLSPTTGSLVKMIFTVVGTNESSTPLTFVPNNCRILNAEIEDMEVTYQNGSFHVVAGSLKVTIDPEAARTAGAKWTVDGSTWYDSATEVILTPGNYTVQYKTIDNWNTPPQEEVVVEEDIKTEKTGTYTHHKGSLAVTIDPEAARTAGAKWSIDSGVTWKESGDTLSNIPTGTYTVTYKVITGWTKPGDTPISVIKNQEATTKGTYTRDKGSLKVTIDPEAARTAEARWSIDSGVTWKESGDTLSNIPTGTYTVTYKVITGWTKPGDTPISVIKNQEATTKGTYTRDKGSLKVTIDPEAARTAGAQWSIDGGKNWNNSGEPLLEIPTGDYTITFKPI